MRALGLALASAFVVSPPPVRPTKLYFFDQLSNSMATIADTFQGKKRLTPKSIATALKTVKRALLESDVNIKVANALVGAVEKKALGQTISLGASPSEQFLKIMFDELVEVMGGSGDVDDKAGLAKSKEGKVVILLCGLQGAGKTTAAAKLAKYLQDDEGRTACLVAADVYRPAAAEQLRILGEQAGVRVYSEENSTDAVGIALRGVETANESAVVVDTAGRQVVEESLMDELVKIRSAIEPQETLLVLDSMTGQDAARLCAKFNEACPLTGAVLTKFDGDARGGAALSVKAVSGVPIKFMGVGERLTDLEAFYPARMASRILNMGDLATLMEKAQKLTTEEETDELVARASKGGFNFNDYLEQAKGMDKLGSVKNVMKMMPGANLDDAKIMEVEDKIERVNAICSVMTPEERENPDLLIGDVYASKRIERIRQAAGYDLATMRMFLKEFQQVRNMMRNAGKGMGDVTDAIGGSRAARRAMKKKKGRRGLADFGGGFG